MSMRARIVFALVALLVVVSVGGLQATAAGGKKFSAALTGYEETPTLSVEGTGSFSAELSKDGESLTFTLSWSALTGSASQAHIHLGMPAIAGAPIAFLCGGGGQPACPAGTSASFTRTVTEANLVTVPTQGFEGDFDELVAAMRFGATYVNVHTAAFGGGEVRGQVG
jgi:hypothetical protein